jgi:hypothetical protein
MVGIVGILLRGQLSCAGARVCAQARAHETYTHITIPTIPTIPLELNSLDFLMGYLLNKYPWHCALLFHSRNIAKQRGSFRRGVPHTGNLHRRAATVSSVFSSLNSTKVRE